MSKSYTDVDNINPYGEYENRKLESSSTIF